MKSFGEVSSGKLFHGQWDTLPPELVAKVYGPDAEVVEDSALVFRAPDGQAAALVFTDPLPADKVFVVRARAYQKDDGVCGFQSLMDGEDGPIFDHEFAARLVSVDLSDDDTDTLTLTWNDLAVNDYASAVLKGTQYVFEFDSDGSKLYVRQRDNTTLAEVISKDHSWGGGKLPEPSGALFIQFGESLHSVWPCTEKVDVGIEELLVDAQYKTPLFYEPPADSSVAIGVESLDISMTYTPPPLAKIMAALPEAVDVGMADLSVSIVWFEQKQYSHPATEGVHIGLVDMVAEVDYVEPLQTTSEECVTVGLDDVTVVVTLV